MTNQWLDTFIDEKGINLDEEFIVQGDFYGDNHMTYGVIAELIKSTTLEEKRQIKQTIQQIDFNNGDVKRFFRFLGDKVAK